MNDDTAFLRAIMKTPGDASERRAYADWLEHRADPRSRSVRMDAGIDRINLIDWLEADGHIDYYLERSPEVRRLAEQRRSSEATRQELEVLNSHFDPDWVAFMNTLACPFREFYFFSNHGEPQECTTEELPFKEPIGTRGAVITFGSAFSDDGAWDAQLMPDLRFLCELELRNCYYGAATCPVHPFICECTTEHDAMTGAEVLAALKPRNFRSEHIATLNATEIPFPGYHPNTDNDEIHNDSGEQNIFDYDESTESSGAHGALKRYVKDGKLWYVLLHMTPEELAESFWASRYVVLLAVGRSPNGRRLVGVISHQVCHNLCD